MIYVGEREICSAGHFAYKSFIYLWCNGSTIGSNPISQGSNPWGYARHKMPAFFNKLNTTDVNIGGVNANDGKGKPLV